MFFFLYCADSWSLSCSVKIWIWTNIIQVLQYYIQKCMVLKNFFTYENYGWEEGTGLCMGRKAVYDVQCSDCRHLTYAVSDLLWCSAVDFFPCVHKHSSNKTELCVDGCGLYIAESPLWRSLWTMVSNIMLGLTVNLSLIWLFNFVTRKM